MTDRQIDFVGSVVQRFRQIGTDILQTADKVERVEPVVTKASVEVGELQRQTDQDRVEFEQIMDRMQLIVQRMGDRSETLNQMQSALSQVSELLGEMSDESEETYMDWARAQTILQNLLTVFELYPPAILAFFEKVDREVLGSMIKENNDLRQFFKEMAEFGLTK